MPQKLQHGSTDLSLDEANRRNERFVSGREINTAMMKLQLKNVMWKVN